MIQVFKTFVLALAEDISWTPFIEIRKGLEDRTRIRGFWVWMSAKYYLVETRFWGDAIKIWAEGWVKFNV